MKCEEAKKYLEGIPENKKIRSPEFFAHIKKCENCRAEYEAVKKIAAAFSMKEKIKAPRGFNKAVWEKIGEPAPSFVEKLLGSPVFYAAGAAAAAIMVLIVFFAVIPGGTKPDKYKLAENKKVIKEKKAGESGISRPGGDKNGSAVEKDIASVSKKSAGIETEKKPARRSIFDSLREGNVSGKKEEPVKMSKKTGGKSDVSAAKRVETPEHVMKEDIKIFNNVIKPFQGEKIVIQYKVNEPADISVRVYNRMGEPVVDLVNEKKPQGAYKTAWKGLDEKGRVVDAGVYLIYIKTGLVEKKIKAVVIK